MSSTSTSTSHTVLPLVGTGATLDGKKAYLKALRKFGISTTHYHTHQGTVYKRNKPHPPNSQLELHHFVHSHVIQRVATAPLPEDVAEVPAQEIDQNSEYIVPVEMGTPAVTLNLDFDTGSSDLWVKGPRAGGTVYDPAKSSTAKHVPGANWKVGYGDGSSALGNVYTDVIKIGSITLHDQAIGVAQVYSQSFVQDKSSGLLGLAWPCINTVKPQSVPTPVANMIGQGHPGIFSCVLDYGDSKGFYTFGGIDAAKAGVEESDIKYIPCVSPPQYWTVISTKIIVNNKTLSLPIDTAILDTGTTLCLLSEATVEDVYKQIPGSKYDTSEGHWLIPRRAKVPKIRIDLGGYEFEFNPKSFAYQKDVEDGYDMGCIQSCGNLPVNILGDAVLNALYVVFDQEKNRVGIAQRIKDDRKAEEPEPSILDRIFPWFRSPSKVNLNE